MLMRRASEDARESANHPACEPAPPSVSPFHLDYDVDLLINGPAASIALSSVANVAGRTARKGGGLDRDALRRADEPRGDAWCAQELVRSEVITGQATNQPSAGVHRMCVVPPGL
jgi:hypothetical protein